MYTNNSLERIKRMRNGEKIKCSRAKRDTFPQLVTLKPQKFLDATNVKQDSVDSE